MVPQTHDLIAIYIQRQLDSRFFMDVRGTEKLSGLAHVNEILEFYFAPTDFKLSRGDIEQHLETCSISRQYLSHRMSG
jgi:hypothetical protein